MCVCVCVCVCLLLAPVVELLRVEQVFEVIFYGTSILLQQCVCVSQTVTKHLWKNSQRLHLFDQKYSKHTHTHTHTYIYIAKTIIVHFSLSKATLLLITIIITFTYYILLSYFSFLSDICKTVYVCHINLMKWHLNPKQNDENAAQFISQKLCKI